MIEGSTLSVYNVKNMYFAAEKRTRETFADQRAEKLNTEKKNEKKMLSNYRYPLKDKMTTGNCLSGQNKVKT